jgi:hypothetical protein
MPHRTSLETASPGTRAAAGVDLEIPVREPMREPPQPNS